MLLFYALAIIASVAQGTFSKLNSRGGKGVMSYNFYMAVFSTVLFGIMAVLSGEGFHLPTIVYSLLYGIMLCLSMYSGYVALAIGPMAISSMIAAYSLIIPLFYGVFVLGEDINSSGIAGVILLIVSLAFINLKGKSDRNRGEKLTLRWSIMIFLTFATNGLTAILQASHQNRFPGSYSSLYMAGGCAVSLIVFGILKLCSAEKRGVGSEKKTVTFGAFGGIATGLYGFLVLILSGLDNVSVLFPFISVAKILGSLVVGRILFREKLSAMQFIGFILGVISIVLLKI